MLAARDQENLAHTHQQGAAAKPLNHGVRQLQPRTPGIRLPNTPFQRNDENAAFALKGQKTARRTIGRGNENIIHPGKKDAKLERNAFATPAAAKSRAPLGIKTTNAKAKAFETPAPAPLKPLQTVKQPSTAATKKKKSKITIAQPEPAPADVLENDDDDIPDIEYMPPRPVELADPPEDIEYDDTFPQFRGKNAFRGWRQLYGPPIGEDGLTDIERAMEDRLAKQTEDAQRKLDEEINKPIELNDPELEADREVERLIRSHFSGQKKEVDTLKARGAASALNAPAKGLASLSKPTMASQQKARVPPKILPTSKKPTPPPTNPSPMRHTALAAASRSTVGYSKGRNVSSKLSDMTSNSIPSPSKSKNQLTPQQFKDLFGEPPEGSQMWYSLHEEELFGKCRNLMTDLVDLNDDDDSFEINEPLPESDDEEVFQLKLT